VIKVRPVLQSDWLVLILIFLSLGRGHVVDRLRRRWWLKQDTHSGVASSSDCLVFPGIPAMNHFTLEHPVGASSIPGAIQLAPNASLQSVVTALPLPLSGQRRLPRRPAPSPVIAPWPGLCGPYHWRASTMPFL